MLLRGRGCVEPGLLHQILNLVDLLLNFILDHCGPILELL